MTASATNLHQPVTVRLDPETERMAEELRAARDVIDAAEDLAHELSRLSPSAYTWPTTATMEGVNEARRKLTEAIYHYDVLCLRLHGERRPAIPSQVTGKERG